jgi:hypothetical protein
VISPIDIATQGFLDSPLSVGALGFLTLDTGGGTVVEGPGGGGGFEDPRRYTVTPQQLERMRLEQHLREDEEILAIIMAFMEVIQ